MELELELKLELEQQRSVASRASQTVRARGERALPLTDHGRLEQKSWVFEKGRSERTWAILTAGGGGGGKFARVGSSVTSSGSGKVTHETSQGKT